MPAGQEAEHRFPMGELPQEVMDICQRLAKLTEMLRGLAELFLNDLGEKPVATTWYVCIGFCCK